MKLIKHMIFVDVDAESKLMINSLTGTMDEISISTYETLVAWQKLDVINPDTIPLTHLYVHLMRRKYLVEDDAEETSRKEEVLDARIASKVKPL